MSKVAWYPKVDPGNPGGLASTFSQAMKYRPDGANKDSSLSLNETISVLTPYILSAEQRDKNVFIGVQHTAHFGPYGLVVTNPPAPIPVRYYDMPRIKANNRAQWAKAQLPGSIDIVVSPVAHGQIKMTHAYGEINRRVLRTTSVGRTLGTCGLFSMTNNDPNRVTVGGYKRAYVGFQSTYQQVSSDFGPSPFEVGWNDNDVINWFKSEIKKLSPDSSLVTTVLADANSGLIDLLTAVAEAPETFLEAFNGCRTILKMFKEARRREFRLMNKVKARRLDLARAKARTRDEFKDIKAFEKHQQTLRSIEQSIKDLFDAVAGVWLTYRLSIYPTAKTVEAALEYSGMLDKQFLRFRDTEDLVIKPPNFGSFECNGELVFKQRCFIKRGAKQADMRELLLSTNPFLTAWELIPLSFVVDRYMSIGSLLSAFFGNPRSPNVTEGSTFSWRTTSSVSWTDPTTRASVTAEFGYYKRIVIDPNSYVCIPFPKARTRDQSFDHLALAWKILLKNLWKV